jgi:glutamate-1-semialdehyde 2,1-aminomutase
MSFFEIDIKNKYLTFFLGCSTCCEFIIPWLYRRILTLFAIDITNIAARITAPIIRSYSFDDEKFFCADGAPRYIVSKRKAGLQSLVRDFQLGKVGIEADSMLSDGLSDIRFTDTNRVPFPFQKKMQSTLRVASIVTKSDGPVLTDIDGVKRLDVSGSYGVNVVGYDNYKEFIERGWNRIKELGPNVLGPVHPVINNVIKSLRNISGLEEVSFHMSGTEAVMCAIRLARFNKRRRFVVTFAGAYHGWWDGMQPGAGNERFTCDVLSLKDMSPISLNLIRARAHEIAAVIISPLQGLNPGKPPPSDLVLLDSKVRATNERISDYTVWLKKIRKLTEELDIPLIFDEVYTGFRMAPGGAQEFYGIQADMVVYGKTLGGGLPVGVVCGKKELMHRFDKNHPLRVNYVIGTFSAAPIVLATMAEFLKWLNRPETNQLYQIANNLTASFVKETNINLIRENMPLRVDALTTVWTVLFKQPGRYHWMFQYYMRAEGLALSWVGTGRCLFSLDFTENQYKEVSTAILKAARRMKKDGWWWIGENSNNPLTGTQISKQMTKEIIMALIGIKN